MSRMPGICHPVTVAVTGLLLLAGCTSGGSQPRTTVPTPSVATSVGTSTGTSANTPSGAPSPSELPTLASPTISIPPTLCAGARAARDAADAFMGALSAGDLAEAKSCVQPGAVDDALLRELLAHEQATAVYLPAPGSPQSGPNGAVYVYKGNGKTVRVSVARQSGGTYAVSAIRVQTG